MAMKEQIVEKFPVIDNFKGLNLYLNEQIIGLDEATIAQNVELRNGSLSRCNGYTSIDQNGLPTGDKTLMKHYDKGNGKIMVGCIDSIYFQDGSSYKKLKSGFKNTKFNYVNYQIDLDEVTIITNGEDDVLLFDGDKFIPLKHEGSESDEDVPQESGEPNRSPKGKYVTLHKERMWISGDKENPNRVYFSKDFDPHNWTFPVDPENVNMHGGFIDIPTWDGGIIIGMKSLFNDVVVFKNKNVFRIFGTYPGNYNLIQVFDTVDGDIMNNTIATLENLVLWTSTNGIHAFNGTNTEVQSHNISPLFKNVSRKALEDAVAVIHDRRYILSLPMEDGSKLIIEFDIESGNFTTKTDHGVTSFVSIDDKLYFANQTGNLFEYSKGDTFNGKPINMVWENGFNSFGEQQARKILNRVYFKAGGENKVKIASISENKRVSKELPLSSDLGFFRERLRNKGRFIKLRIENVNGGKLTVNQLQFMLDLDYD